LSTAFLNVPLLEDGANEHFFVMLTASDESAEAKAAGRGRSERKRTAAAAMHAALFARECMGVHRFPDYFKGTNENHYILIGLNVNH
jgi:hypothetical protein